MKTNKKLNIAVEEFTSLCPVTVDPQTSLDEVLRILEENNFRHLPVGTIKGDILGIISQRDLNLVRNAFNLDKFTAGDIMEKSPYQVGPKTPLDEVCFEMSSKKIGSALVIDGHGKLLGIFTATDALNALVDICRGEFSN